MRLVDAGLAAKSGCRGADALPEPLHPVLLSRANDLGFGATRELGQPGALQPGSRDATNVCRNPIEYILQLCYPLAMLNPHQRRRLLVADRSGDAGVVTAAITEVLAANPYADPFDVEIAFRDARAQSYLIAGTNTFSIVLGMQAMLAAVTAAGMTVKQNRAALAASFSPRLN